MKSASLTPPSLQEKFRLTFEELSASLIERDQEIQLVLTALLAQTYYALPQYRSRIISPLPDRLKDKDGNLRAIAPGSDDANELNKWLGKNPDFADAVAKDQLALNGWIHDELLRG